MFKFDRIIKQTLILIVITCFSISPSLAKTGKGELKLSKDAMEVVLMYMYGAGNKKYSGNAKRKNKPTIMAVSENGNSYMYSYCPIEYHDGCVPPNIPRIIKACEKYSNGSPCRIFARKRKIVWKNGGPKVRIKSKDLKSPYKVAKMIQDAGFYDGDLGDLAGISVETGQIDDNVKLTGEKKDEDQNVNSNDVVEQLETLTKLYEDGHLSKEEFETQKKKILNN